MFADKLRDYRERKGLSQAALATSINLSLRTIQRLESGKTLPKGHTLRVIQEQLGLEETTTPETTFSTAELNPEAQEQLKYINLSALGFLGIPFGNIILPILLWNRYKSNPFVKEMGKRVISVQVIWSLVLIFVLIISPFAQALFSTNIALILWMGLLMAVFNVVFILKTAKSFGRQDYEVFMGKLNLL